ncbi:MAG: hypothetical protein HY691_20100 [Chloroflexi bacterium]|nr:hypothetical protein [Chloroflexota bacterium]
MPGDGHSGDEQHEVRRAGAGRLELVLTRVRRGDAWLYVLHVRLLSGQRSFQHSFREGDALALLGLTPRPRCPYFRAGCVFAGCHYRELPDDDAAAQPLFDRALASLQEAIAHLVQGAWLAEDVGLPFTRSPTSS